MTLSGARAEHSEVTTTSKFQYMSALNCPVLNQTTRRKISFRSKTYIVTPFICLMCIFVCLKLSKLSTLQRIQEADKNVKVL